MTEQRIEITALDDRRTTIQNGLSRPALCVADIMTTNIVALAPHHTFAEAVQLMSNSRFRHFIVLYADGRLAGVFSDRDVLRALGRTPSWQAEAVSGVMSRYVVTVKPQTPISVAVTEMLTRRINCLPVVGEDGRVCGIITSTDLLKNYHKIQASLEAIPTAEV